MRCAVRCTLKARCEVSKFAAEAKVKIVWGGYVSIELTGQQWAKVETLAKKSNIDAVLSGLHATAVEAGFKLTIDKVDEVTRISITNTVDAFGDGKQYVVQAGSPDLLEALCAALEKFKIWTNLKPDELNLQGERKKRF